MRLLCLILILGLSAPAAATEFRHASVAEARAVIVADAAWFDALGPAEIAIRLGEGQPSEDREKLKQQMLSAVLPWDGKDIAADKAFLEDAIASLAPYEHLLPDEVLFIRITDKIEGGYPHTRSNAILIPAAFHTTGKGLFWHELFHVLSRNLGERRTELYGLLGFQSCRLDWSGKVRERRLSNPDVPLYDTPWLTDEEGRKITPYLHADTPGFDPERGEFGSHFGFGFLVLDVDGNECRPAGDWPVLPASDGGSYFNAIGQNTGYVIHPEEVLADNFISLLNGQTDLPNPEIPRKLDEFLRNVSP